MRDANGQDLSTLVLRQLKVLTNSEAATRGVLCKKVFLEIWQNSQENTCATVSFLTRLQALGYLSTLVLRQLKVLTNSEAATRGVLCKKVFLEIWQNSQENTCTTVSFLTRLQA